MTRKHTRSYSVSVRAKDRLNIRDGAPRFSSTKLAAAVIRGAAILAVLSTLLLITARPAQAQTETVLYNFTGGSDGANPGSRLTFDVAGTLYGTTLLGGVPTIDNNLGNGVVFELSPNGSGGWNETVLHAFDGGLNVGPDGANPSGSVIFDSAGNLYGVTMYGGTDFNYCSYGTIFELSPAGTSWTETLLFSQSCTQWDGNATANGVIMDQAGNLYGTNSAGVFELSPSPGGWTEQTIYGVSASSGLTMDAAGNIYGATSSTVFELSPISNGGWKPTVIYTFAGAPTDGYGAEGTPVLDKTGNLYGTTYHGGANNYGTVYKLSPGENGWTEEILYSFKGGTDGANPVAGIVFDAAGNIYGTTVLGGSKNRGSVFELAALGNFHYEHTVLWTFNGTDGANPYGSLILDSAGKLYGTAASGGSSNAGVVFKVTGVRGATPTTLTSLPNPSTYGQAVSFTAVVTSIVGAPPDGETVTFKKGTTVLGTGSLSNGAASFTTSALPVGANTITAVYGGDLYFLGSTSNAVKQVVKKAPTTTSLTSSSNPSTYGQAVTFSAVVTSSLGAPPDGDTVTFKEGTTVLGTRSLSGGSASLTTSALPGGTNWIMAVYGGDIHFAASTSNAVKQVVKKVATTTTLESSPNPSTYGQAVTFTAVVTSAAAAPPDGDTVTFKEGTTVLGTGSLSGGSASLTTSALLVGTNAIKAVYAGDAIFAGSTSNTVKQVVN